MSRLRLMMRCRYGYLVFCTDGKYIVLSLGDYNARILLPLKAWVLKSKFVYLHCSFF